MGSRLTEIVAAHTAAGYQNGTKRDVMCSQMSEEVTRRAFLRAGLIGGVGIVATLPGCAPAEQRQTRPSTGSQPKASNKPTARILLVYFSRAGENYYNGGRRILDVGNTEVLAKMIERRIDCDVYRIQPADPYSDSYDKTVARNVEEEQADARPAIANPLPDVSRYDTVLLGSPVWNVRAPMIMSTLIEGIDLEGRTILPFVTYAVSGMGSVEEDYRARLSGAKVRTGLAVRGERVSESGSELEAWLRRHQLG